mmetsp:Transcript_5503/g.8546  ORF Transcript_5503/g.8546 Transcript_5503/m.8546 type:complete len:116 (+) Transcript_5503:167-514(+)|eukprot:CAMPEP_0184662270 /NCGR_PEP_ID=MMETSP0308-20130426/42378_1 /TAXON_ID=38269 /ORGANISM="Gloeochaete witrockiana, Strain SAG 46.84" /LENGTH=115 /DNA_ID=CAMNT_0027104153 /DNA_START=106 /DNA_END=453 /DNA_ORIENTATION=-
MAYLQDKFDAFDIILLSKELASVGRISSRGGLPVVVAGLRDEVFSEHHLQFNHDDGCMDDEIIDALAVENSACPNPNRSTSEDPVAKTIAMFDSDYSDLMSEMPSPNFFRPIAAY